MLPVSLQCLLVTPYSLTVLLYFIYSFNYFHLLFFTTVCRVVLFRAFLILYFYFRYCIEISAFNISRYLYQSVLSSLQVIDTFITFFVCCKQLQFFDEPDICFLADIGTLLPLLC